MIFRRDKKRRAEIEVVDEAGEESADSPQAEQGDPAGEEQVDAADGAQSAGPAEDLAALDDLEWRDHGPYDVAEIEDLDEPSELPRIDLGSLILTGTPGSELRLQVSEESGQVISAMLVISTIVEPPASAQQPVETFSSALELGAYAAPRSGGLWAELREEISQSATEAGGSASLAEGPFGVELRRLVPVQTPDGQEGYQPSRMWVAEGPRWLLRGIVYGQAAIEEDLDAPVVADVLTAFRQVIVRRGDEAMAPGDLLPLTMPAGAVPGGGS